MLLKASFNSIIQKEKDGLFNKVGAAPIGYYSVGKVRLSITHATYKNIPDGPEI